MESSDESLSETGSFAFANACYYDEDVLLGDSADDDFDSSTFEDRYSNRLGQSPISGDISSRIAKVERLLQPRTVLVPNYALGGGGVLDLEPIERGDEEEEGCGLGDNRKRLEPLRPRTKRGAHLVRPPSRMGREKQGKQGYGDSWAANTSLSEHLDAAQDEPLLVDLFNYAHAYKPYKVRCPIKLYFPDMGYVPAVDPVYTPVEVARPDGRDLKLGIDVLNDASVNQSDSTILRLKHAAISKTKPGGIIFKRVAPGVELGPAIDAWIRDVKTVDALRPPASCCYTTPMPELTDLLEPWPRPISHVLSRQGFSVEPGLDCDLQQYVTVLCCLFGIPVMRDKTVQALHLLFTLYLECRDQKYQ